MSIPEDADLSQFNFDINLDIPMNSGDLDFSNFDPLQPVDFSQLSYLPSTPQYGMDQWADLPVSHSRPHPSASTQDSGQLDVNPQDSWIYALPDSVSNRRTHPSSFSQESGDSSLFSTANVSPQTAGTLADEIWPDGPGDPSSSSQFYGRVQQPLSERSPPRTSSLQQLQFESPMDGGTASPYLSHAQQSLSNGSPTDISTHSPAEGSGSGSSASSRTSLQNDDIQYWTESTDKTRRGRESPASTLASRQLSSSSKQGHSTDSTARQDDQANRVYTGLQHPEGITFQSPAGPNSPPRPSQSSLGFSNDVFGLANSCTLVSESLRAVKQGPAECPSLASDLQRLRTVLIQYRSETVNTNVESDGITRDTASQIHAFSQQLEGLSARLRTSQVQDSPLQQGYLRQSQVQAQQIPSSLCARINNLQTPSTGISSPGGDLYQPLSSGRNLQLFVPASEGHDRDRHTQSREPLGVESMYDDHLNAQGRQDDRSTPPRPNSHAIRLEEDERRYALAFYKDAYEGAFAHGVGSGVAVTAVQYAPSHPLFIKEVERSTIKAEVDRTLESTEMYLGFATHTSFDEQEQLARQVLDSGVSIDVFEQDVYNVDRQREIAERTQPNRVSRSQPTPPTDLTHEEESTAASPNASSLQYVGRPRDESQLHSCETFSRGAIPRTTVELQASSHAVDLGTVTAASHEPVLNIVLHYSKIVVCAALASAFVASVCRPLLNSSYLNNVMLTSNRLPGLRLV
jgi:hypothetical protein